MKYSGRKSSWLPTAVGKRAILPVFVVSVAIFPPAMQAQARGPRVADSVVGIDKLKHFLMAGFVESVAFAGLQAAGANRDASFAGAGATVAVVSLGREFNDRRTKGLFSFGDLLWDAFGAGAALLVLTKVQR